MGIFTWKDIIYHLPRKYEDLHPTHENDLKDKERIVLVGNIVGNPMTRRFSKMAVTTFSFVTKKKNVFYVEAWNRPYLTKTLEGSDTFTLIGNYDQKKNKINLINITKGEIKDSFIKPIYTLPRDIDNYEFSRLVQKAFKEIQEYEIYNEIPAYYITKYRLEKKIDALYLAHFPKDSKEIYKGLRVLKYEECLLFSLKTQMIRNQNIRTLCRDKTSLPPRKGK